MSAFWDHLWHLLANFAPKFGVGVLIVFVSWLLGVLGKAVLERLGRRFGEGREAVFRLFGSACKIALFVIGIITALGTMGVNVAALVAGLGLGGFALGFALKDILSNLLAGMLILVNRPFERGDRIAVAGCEGVVTDITLRYTHLAGADRNYLIPNATLFSNVIHLVPASQREPTDGPVA